MDWHIDFGLDQDHDTAILLTGTNLGAFILRLELPLIFGDLLGKFDNILILYIDLVKKRPPSLIRGMVDEFPSELIHEFLTLLIGKVNIMLVVVPDDLHEVVLEFELALFGEVGLLFVEEGLWRLVGVLGLRLGGMGLVWVDELVRVGH